MSDHPADSLRSFRVVADVVGWTAVALLSTASAALLVLGAGLRIPYPVIGSWGLTLTLTAFGIYWLAAQAAREARVETGLSRGTAVLWTFVVVAFGAILGIVSWSVLLETLATGSAVARSWAAAWSALVLALNAGGVALVVLLFRQRRS